MSLVWCNVDLMEKGIVKIEDILQSIDVLVDSEYRLVSEGIASMSKT